MSKTQAEWVYEAALAVQEGERQEAERHVAVDGQVRGYLRWFGPLQSMAGYWPLAEAISVGCKDQAVWREEMERIVGLCAEERGVTATRVRGNMARVIAKAMRGNPTCASQVLEGLSDRCRLGTFVISSVRWLGRFELCLRTEAYPPYRCEAVWRTYRNTGKYALFYKVGNDGFGMMTPQQFLRRFLRYMEMMKAQDK